MLQNGDLWPTWLCWACCIKVQVRLDGEARIDWFEENYIKNVKLPGIYFNKEFMAFWPVTPTSHPSPAPEPP